MANQELVNFIQAQLERGVPEGEVRNALLQNGWQEADVTAAMSAGTDAPAQPPVAAANPGPAAMDTVQPQSPVGEPVDMFDSVDSPQQATVAGQQGQIAQFGQQVGQQVGQVLRAPIDATMNVTKTVAGNAMQAAGDMKQAVEEQMPGVFNNPSITGEGSRLAAGQQIEPDGHLSDGSQSQIEIKEGLGTTARIMVFLLVTLGVVGLIGGGIWGYFYVTRSPERVSQLFLNGVSTVQSTAFTGNVTENGEQLYAFSGSFDTNAPSFNIKMTSTDEATGADYGMEISAVANNMFGTFHTEVDGEAVGDVGDSWIELDGSSAATLITTVLPVKGTISTQLSLPITEADRQVLATAIQAYPFVSGFEKTHNTTYNGSSAAVYRGTLDGENLKKFVESGEQELRTAGLTSTLVGRMKSSQMPYNGAQVTLTIDRQSYQLYKFVLRTSEGRELTIEFSDYTTPIVAPQNIITAEEMFEMLLTIGSEETAETNEDAEKADEDAEVDTAVDTKTDSIEEAEEELDTADEKEEVAEETETTEKTVDTEEVKVDTSADIDTDGDGLTDADEDKYGTNPTKQDTDNDGFLDGEEVANGYNPLGEGKLELK